MYKDIITVSTVCLRPIWGNKEVNLNRIEGYVEAAGKKGSDLILFPEMSLTGYDDEPEKPVAEKMQHKLAEKVPGPSSLAVAEIAKKYGMYVIFGMPILDDDDPSIVYNGLAVISPDGSITSYHKLHLPAPEPNWATRGDKPCLLQTPWGPIGIGICYDTYSFPELMRYYVAKGARLYLNPTAICYAHGDHYADENLHAAVDRENIFIVSANLGGLDKDNYFWGGSSILGPSVKTWSPHYYAGMAMTDKGADEEAMYTATIDLALASRMLYKYNPSVEGTDWRPDVYEKLLKDAMSDESFGK